MLLKNRLIIIGLFFGLLVAACVPQGVTSTVSETGTNEQEVTETETRGPGVTETIPDQNLPTQTQEPQERELNIVTLLPRDAIPAIDKPTFLGADEADQEYEPEELVIGVEFNGDARAYSIPFLSGHEIVNDTVGGVKIAVTW